MGAYGRSSAGWRPAQSAGAKASWLIARCCPWLHWEYLDRIPAELSSGLLLLNGVICHNTSFFADSCLYFRNSGRLTILSEAKSAKFLPVRHSQQGKRITSPPRCIAYQTVIFHQGGPDGKLPLPNVLKRMKITKQPGSAHFFNFFDFLYFLVNGAVFLVGGLRKAGV